MSWLSKLIDDNYEAVEKTLNSALEKMGLEEFPDHFSELDSLDVQAMREEEAEPLELIVEDYYSLLREICKENKPESVKLCEDDCFEVTIDGTCYYLDEHFEHDDVVNTERKMRIEALLADGIAIGEVEALLNERIAACWNE